MTRREFFGSTSAMILAGAAGRLPLLAQAPAAAGAGQATQAPAVTKFEDLRRGVGIFTGQGGTIGWLATPDGALVVDSQFPATAGACLAGLKERSPKGIELLINTHHHGDHVSGNPTFRDAVHHIVQQEKCAKYHRLTTEKAGTAAQQAYADVTFGGSWSTTVGNEKVWAYYDGRDIRAATRSSSSRTPTSCTWAIYVQSAPPVRRSAQRRLDQELGQAAREERGEAQGRDVHRGPRQTRRTGHRRSQAPARIPRLLFSRRSITSRRGSRQGSRRPEITSLAALPKFEDYASPAPMLSLSGVLTTAYEELTNKPVTP